MTDQHGGGYIPGGGYVPTNVNVSNYYQKSQPEMHGGSYIPGNDQSTHSGPVVTPEMRGGNYIPGSGRPAFEPVVSPVQYDAGKNISRRPVASAHSGTVSPGSAVSQTDPYDQYNSYQYQGQPQYQAQPTYQAHPPYHVQPQYQAQPPYHGQPLYQIPHGSREISSVRTNPYSSSGPSANGGKSAGIYEEVQIVDVAEAVEQNAISNQRRNMKEPFVPLKGYKHLFARPQAFRLFKSPHFYKPADHVFISAERFKNKDSMLRLWEGDMDDRYISPQNGRTEELVVQAVDNIYEYSTSEGTWNRTFVRDISPWHLRLANWPESHIRYQDRMNGNVKKRQKLLKACKYIPAAMALVAVIVFPGNVEGEIRNGGRYDAFPYKFHGYSKVARNLLEEKIARKHATHGDETHAVMTNRILMPRKLCYVDRVAPTSDNPNGLKLEDITERVCEPYLFVAYTTKQFPHHSKEHLDRLLQMAAQATRDHDLGAFWIGCSCMGSDGRTLSSGSILQNDVYRISDVIRGAKAVAIMVGPPAVEHGEHDPTKSESKLLGERLCQWGERVWTFPEVLLSPRGKAIRVYNVGSEHHFNLEKNQFAQMVWPDKNDSRQLIDHYEGNLILSRLELVTIALECLHSRQHGKFLNGDHSYALMGLLLVRPEVDESDSDFQAFARLSLANDSDKLLERLACVLPRKADQPWYSMDDAYETKLWDIYPSCQTAGIGDDNTIIVDGARGANVRWKSFASVHVRRKWSWMRMLFRFMLHTSSLAFIVGVILLCFANWVKVREQQAAALYVKPFRESAYIKKELVDAIEGASLEFIQSIIRIMVDARAIKAWAIIFMLWSIPMMCLTPVAVQILYSGKLWNTQPWLFGFEGYMPIGQIEYLIFGDQKGRLRWHPFGSPLSRHKPDETFKGGHCDAVDPITDPLVKQLVDDAKTSQLGDQKIFTLVDTNTMTVTMFQAASPPICFLLLGAEGGMQRAVGCSYDWTTGILYRETVLRMETSCIDKMDLVSRARISLEKRVLPETQAAAPQVKTKVNFKNEKFVKRKKSVTKIV